MAAPDIAERVLKMIAGALGNPDQEIAMSDSLVDGVGGCVDRSTGGGGLRPSPAMPSRIVTTHIRSANKVIIPKAVVWSKKPRPRR